MLEIFLDVGDFIQNVRAIDRNVRDFNQNDWECDHIVRKTITEKDSTMLQETNNLVSLIGQKSAEM